MKGKTNIRKSSSKENLTVTVDNGASAIPPQQPLGIRTASDSIDRHNTTSQPTVAQPENIKRKALILGGCLLCAATVSTAFAFGTTAIIIASQFKDNSCTFTIPINGTSDKIYTPDSEGTPLFCGNNVKLDSYSSYVANDTVTTNLNGCEISISNGVLQDLKTDKKSPFAEIGLNDKCCAEFKGNETHIEVGVYIPKTELEEAYCEEKAKYMATTFKGPFQHAFYGNSEDSGRKL